MNTKMKIALTDLKYIQSQIQKILNLEKDNSKNKKGKYFQVNQRLLKPTFSSGIKKDNEKISPRNKNNFFPQASSPRKSNTSFKSIESQRGGNSSKSFSTNKKETHKRKDNSQVIKGYTKEDNDKTLNKESNQPQKFSLKISQVQQNLNRFNLQKSRQAGMSNSSLESINEKLSTKDLTKKWMQQISSQKEEKPNIKQERTKQIKTIRENKEVKQQLSTKKRKSSSLSSKSAKLRVSTKKNYQSKQQQEKTIIYQKPEKQVIPYHLDARNKKPLRTDQNYLSNKYKYKKLTKKEARQQTLREKYYILDLKLKRIRQKMHSQALICNQNIRRKKSATHLDENSEKTLNKYLRYSPLSKLLRANQRYKLQHQRNSSKNLPKTKDQLKAIKVMESGRPIQQYWNN